MVTVDNNTTLLEQIKEKQIEMYEKAKEFGMTHPIVVMCSQELDDLLNMYQDIRNK